MEVQTILQLAGTAALVAIGVFALWVSWHTRPRISRETLTVLAIMTFCIAFWRLTDTPLDVVSPSDARTANGAVYGTVLGYLGAIWIAWRQRGGWKLPG